MGDEERSFSEALVETFLKNVDNVSTILHFSFLANSVNARVTSSTVVKEPLQCCIRIDLNVTSMPNMKAIRARLRLRMKAARNSNRPTYLDTTKLKTVALENLRVDLRNHFEGLQLDEDASLEDEWRELKDAVAAHLGKRVVAVGTGSLVKRLLWLSKRAWQGFKVHHITGF